MKREQVDKFLNKGVIIKFRNDEIESGILEKIENYGIKEYGYASWCIREGYHIRNLCFRLAEIVSIEEI